jgi:phosphatidylglycerol lysyltransferase
MPESEALDEQMKPPVSGGALDERSSWWEAFSWPHSPILVIALAVFGSGCLNLYSVLGGGLTARLQDLRLALPLEIVDSSRSLVVGLGFLQLISAWQLLRRKRRAWWLCLALALAAPVLHLLKGLDYEEAALSALLVAALWWTRENFTVRSRDLNWRAAAWRAAAVAGAAVAYGVAGFWLLNPSEFGVRFQWTRALRETVLALGWGTTALVPRTAYAVCFLDSLELLSAGVAVYAAWSLFRPVLYRFRTHAADAAEARNLVEQHGRTSRDFFKYSLDKSFFFGAHRRGFVAYRVGAGLALVLGDPVAERREWPQLLAEFLRYCQGNGWRVAFHQASRDWLPVYESAGLKALKLGDEAIVRLDQFTMEGKAAKNFRTKLKQFEREGITCQRHPAPLSGAVLDQAEAVSREWLSLPGRRERQFTLGKFDRDYLRGTDLLAAYAPDGAMLGFVNFIPSYHPGEITLDLMRRRENPNGIMDYVLLKAFADAQARGFTRFSLGLAPMSGFQPGERSTADERAIHALFQRLQFIFRFQGLKAYKAKFAHAWEPLYVVYQSAADLPRIPLALSRVSELAKEE